MELVNLVVIITMLSMCISWAMRKKKEIESTTIDFDGEAIPTGEDRTNIFADENDLRYTAEVFQTTVLAMLKKIVNICVVVFACMSVVVWVSVHFSQIISKDFCLKNDFWKN